MIRVIRELQEEKGRLEFLIHRDPVKIDVSRSFSYLL